MSSKNAAWGCQPKALHGVTTLGVLFPVLTRETDFCSRTDFSFLADDCDCLLGQRQGDGNVIVIQSIHLKVQCSEPPVNQVLC